ncbi:MAG: alginate lyase family protein [candidate division KSB1 bacterium]|nr:alginate lyase family protein [candidate division KSB1 bacterium]MDZ7364302.1 alginate lyase family protein [candidate division KSB1 bacterium]MDZ7405025.1 alginate lyase family protein [candidate division KSB1 bacterium]
MSERKGVRKVGAACWAKTITRDVSGFFFIGIFILGMVSGAKSQSTPVTAGYRDFYFGTTVSSEPTYGKPQSKLWWNDNLWWGILWNPSANRFEIYRFDIASQSWISTNTAADTRSGSKADVLWDGQRLYVASHSHTTTPAPTTTASSARLYRYSYNSAAKTYSLDAGFPVNVNNSKSETLTLDKDSTGKLWVTWVENQKVMINRSLGNDLTWGTPFILPVQGNDTDPDDISTLLAFDGNKIGVMWTSQTDSTNYFAVHVDGNPDETWQPREVAISGEGLGRVSDDHLNVIASRDGSGNLYAAALTNLSGAKATGLFILKRSPAGVWTRHSFATANLNHSRPIVGLSDEMQRLYVFTRSTDTGPGIVYLKSASLSEMVFPAGLGTPIMQSASDLDITNPTSTKQVVTRASGILVLAADKTSRYYLHNYIDLVSNAPQITSFTPAHGPVGTPVTITGSQFSSTTKVLFNGTAVASFTINSDTQISTTVPTGATNGKITVVNAFDAGSSATDYLVTAPPVVSSFMPTDGPVGAQVTISGSNFTGATQVAFNGTNAPVFTVDSDTQLRANVPTGATTGKITVTNADGSGSSVNSFIVTRQPIISSFAPIRGVAGTEIIMTGSRFSGATSVVFNGKTTTFTLDSDTQIRAKVPSGTTSGPISISNSAGTGASSTSFIMQYTLTVLTSGSGSVTVNPPDGVYDEGATVTLTAVPATGWRFNDWDDDIDGTDPVTTVVMDANKKVTADFRAIAQYSVTINTVGAGSVTLDPPGGVYYNGTVVTLTATPAPGNVFSGYSGDFKGWMNVETMVVDGNKNLTATFSNLPAPRFASGIWTSAAEVSKLPTSGMAWDNLMAGANEPIGAPNLADNEDSVNVAILAKALVFARTGDQSYRQAVISACMAAIGTEGGETLALGRELLAYVLAADLVGLPPAEEATFRAWLRNLLTTPIKGQTLRSSNEQRPNNWGTHCGATRAAIARYLGDATELERTARVFKGWLGDRNTYRDFTYSANELAWQADPNAPVGINPLGATIQGHSVDGVLPDDQRRAGPFTWPPPKENYVYGALQGALMQAIILYRAGYNVWNWENQALLRAVKWLYNEANYPAEGDDEWLIHIVNYFYNTNFPAPFPCEAGKNAGWTDWLYGSRYALTVSKNNGNVEIHSLGGANDASIAMKLTAIPSAGYLFNGWSGDLTGFKNPDTLLMNANKNVIANFVKAGPFTITVNTVGSGAVTLNPRGGVYAGGTVVTLTASPASGFKFTGWSGGLTGSNNPATLMLTGDKTITATFTAVYNLTVTAVGSGTVALNPPSGPYEVGQVVTLTAAPAADHQFVEWSGDLTGVTNPATITMNANKNVTAKFTAIGVVHEETQSGGSSNSTVVTTAGALTGATGHLYLAAISTRPKVKVNSVSGLGLTWTLLKAQCSGRDMIGVEVWMAQGMPSGNGTVTANLASAPYNAVIAVSRYSGAAANPIGGIISVNTNGVNGNCSGGTDNALYSFNHSVVTSGVVMYGAAGMRGRSHTPGTGYRERIEIKQGTENQVASVAIQDKVAPNSGNFLFNGAFSGSTDWAVISVKIKPKTGAEPTVRHSEDPDSMASGPRSSGAQLLPNYPNPFNAQTRISYILPEEAKVRLLVYNIHGQKIRTLVDNVQAPGRYSINWNGRDQLDRDAGSGVYIIRLEAGAQKLTRRVMLVN